MNEGHPAEGNEGLFSGFFKKFGRGKREEDVTEEIMDMVNESHEQGVIAENEAEMIGNIFEFAEKQAEDVMTHRKNIVALDAALTVSEAFDIVMEESFSRYPVYDGDIDNIIGILHIRDLLKVYVKEVQDYVMSFPQSQELRDKLFDLISFLIPHYVTEGKSRLVIAFGCTGGKHRSVTFAELTAAYLREKGLRVRTLHRDAEKK